MKSKTTFSSKILHKYAHAQEKNRSVRARIHKKMIPPTQTSSRAYGRTCERGSTLNCGQHQHQKVVQQIGKKITSNSYLPEQQHKRRFVFCAASSSTEPTTTTKRKPNAESVAVQRRLARQMAEAQAGWIVLSEEEKKKKKKTVTDEESTNSEEEDEDALYNLSLVNATVVEEAYARGKWLIFLLVLQSCSSFVLSSNEALIQDNVIITLYLTMLVGAGGNAGNQSAIKIIEKIVLGEITVSIGSFLKEMHREIIVGTLLCVLVAIGGFVRAYITHGRARGGFLNVLALTCCLAVIVFSSTLIGVMLPFLLAKFGADPAHAGTVVQVVMDITGVIVTVTICSMMLPSVSKKTRTPAFAAILERAFLAYFPENESGNVQKEHRSDADLVMTSGKGSV